QPDDGHLRREPGARVPDRCQLCARHDLLDQAGRHPLHERRRDRRYDQHGLLDLRRPVASRQQTTRREGSTMCSPSIGRRPQLIAALVATTFLAVAASAGADPVKCQKQIVKSLATYKKTFLKAHEKCLDKQNEGSLPGPCPDPVAAVKILTKKQAASDKIVGACAPADLTAL